jgi:membrane fusion protein (multidrug efflux system)
MTDAALKVGEPPLPISASDRRAFRLPFSLRTLGAVTLALIVAAGGLVYIVSPKPSESTDAAYVEADSALVSPKVSGLVAEVLVAHNQPVRKGDPLVRIDPETFDARVASAQADLANAEAGVEAARAALVSLNAEEALAASNVRSAASQIKAADAQSAKAEADQRRFDNLAGQGWATRRDAEAYQAAAVTAQSEAERVRAQVDVSRDQAAVTGAKRAALQAGLDQAQAAVVRAQAALVLARQDQAHSVILAPIDGVVGDRQVEPGDYVQPGSRLMTIVPLNALYVTANFKETQVSRMVAGQPAEVRVDALPGVVLKGRVDSFAPGSGSQFSLLPFEPGTGNFTKIVQRVPVRIRFDPGQSGLDRLRPGLSTTVTVKLDGKTA